ncbi:MAG: precorrin-3B C(17)-methyltransferase [Nitrospina sp.]|jgi:cobalt-factor III methyltransferase|nr:precorrin-3B C(17)-methyltransferase [Nitrospina sp.]
MGKLYLVSIGPGALDMIIPRACEALKKCEIIIGHQLYLDLIHPLIADKKQIANPWGKEIERVDLAIQKTVEGNNVGLISSGDIGVYGLGGLALERLSEKNLEIDYEIIPGITSANACASILGAPLAHDFLTLSLSDLLVPKETILKRATSAAEGGFVSVLYNVQSSKRKELVYEVLKKFRPHRSPDTPCGIVSNAFRAEEKNQIVAFENLFSMQFDMLTTLVLGNDATRVVQNKMVTQRGYSFNHDK